MPAPSSPVQCLIAVSTDPPAKRYPGTAWFYPCQFRVGAHLIGMLPTPFDVWFFLRFGAPTSEVLSSEQLYLQITKSNYCQLLSSLECTWLSGWAARLPVSAATAARGKWVGGAGLIARLQDVPAAGMDTETSCLEPGK